MNNENMENLKMKAEEDVKKYVPLLSDKSSSVTRNIVFGLIAAIWGISINNNTFQPNKLIAIALVGFVLYLFMDFLQYFISSIRYVNSYYKFKKPETTIDEHEAEMTATTRFSYRWFIVKQSIFVLTSLYFIVILYITVI